MEGCHPGINRSLDPINGTLKLPQPQLVQRQETLMMGIELLANRPIHPTAAEIPQLWTRFWAEQMQRDLVDGINVDGVNVDAINAQTLYGVYSDYAGDCRNDSHDYSLILATEVYSIDNPPENMVGITIPAGYYLLFGGGGSPVDTAMQIWPQIWSYFDREPPYQRAFTTDFELYEPQQTSVYIAVKSEQSRHAADFIHW